MPNRYPSEDPREWLNRAMSDLTLAKVRGEHVYLEDLCFHTQQAVEKAVKALLIKRKVDFPYVHNIARLLRLLEQAGQRIPPSIREAAKLTKFAVVTRYPGTAPAISQKEYEEAVRIAKRVVRWAENRLKGS